MLRAGKLVGSDEALELKLIADAVSAYERDYVQRAGYKLGPRGEWIAAMPAADR